MVQGYRPATDRGEYVPAVPSNGGIRPGGAAMLYEYGGSRYDAAYTKESTDRRDRSFTRPLRS
jgi:hypothetical protein